MLRKKINCSWQNVLGAQRLGNLRRHISLLVKVSSKRSALRQEIYYSGIGMNVAGNSKPQVNWTPEGALVASSSRS